MTLCSYKESTSTTTMTFYSKYKESTSTTTTAFFSYKESTSTTTIYKSFIRLL